MRHTRKAKYISRYPLLREAARIFQREGTPGLEKWVSRLSFEEKARLASNMIMIISHRSGRDPGEVALEIFRGKGSLQ